MKLKCIKHDKRVMVLDTPEVPTVVHRSDGEHCKTSRVKIHNNTFSPLMVLLFVNEDELRHK